MRKLKPKETDKLLQYLGTRWNRSCHEQDWQSPVPRELTVAEGGQKSVESAKRIPSLKIMTCTMKQMKQGNIVKNRVEH